MRIVQLKMAANMKVCAARLARGLFAKVLSFALRSPCCILTSGAPARGESELVCCCVSADIADLLSPSPHSGLALKGIEYEYRAVHLLKDGGEQVCAVEE